MVSKDLQEIRKFKFEFDERINFIEDNAVDSTGKKIKDLKEK